MIIPLHKPLHYDHGAFPLPQDRSGVRVESKWSGSTLASGVPVEWERTAGECSGVSRSPLGLHSPLTTASSGTDRKINLTRPRCGWRTDQLGHEINCLRGRR
jgi:hypothetical protein